MGRRKKGNVTGNQFWESAFFNTVTWRYYYDRLKEIAISSFNWKNLPDSVNPRFMELKLFDDGAVVFFNDDVMGDICLQTSLSGRLDVYGEPITSRAYGVNGYQKKVNNKNSVTIHNNMLHTNCVTDIKMFAMRLANIDRVIDININAQKTPILIKSSENERLSMRNLYMQYDGSMPFIFGSDTMNDANFTVLKTDAPFIAPQLYELKTNLWNEALTYLGIANVNITKRERLVSDEVLRSQGGSIASRFSRLEMRKLACAEINKMFGLNVSVEFREELDTDLSTTKNTDASRETLSKDGGANE